MAGVALDEILVADDPESWREAGFTVDDDGIVAVGTVRVRLLGRDAGRRIVGWSLRGLPDGTTDLDGLPTTASTAPPPGPVTHPNGAIGLDHIVILSPDVERTVAVLAAAGVEERRRRETDQYGFPGVQVFFRLGEPILELVGAAVPNGDGPAAFFGLAWTVEDIDTLPDRFGPTRLGDIKAAVQPGRRIATLRHKEVGMSVATAFMSPEPA